MSEPKVPYPPSPTDVPEGLTDYAESYTKQQNLLLAGLFVFLIFYIGAIVLFGMVGVWCFLTVKGQLPVLKIIGMILSGTFFLYLIKGFFKRHPMNKEMHIEITEDEHPVLFEFIYKLCEELGAPEPNKVYVSPDVNAAVMPRTSLINLFVEPKKDLLIGLGLVNCVNLSEFKAVLAHEFGHFSQSAMASSYTYVASRIIGDLVEGEDWFDRWIDWFKRQENVLSIFGHFVGACLWVGRTVLEWLYKAITLQRLAVSREREFHADLVAVSAAGSNAVVHCLLRTEFGHQCFMQAIDDLATALDHKLYTKDLYLHQDRAAAVVRRKKKESDLGLPPAIKSPKDGEKIRVFDAEEEEMTDDIPPMWRTHPKNSEREENAKEQFVPAVADHRSPWLLFGENAAELRERMSYKFYRMVFRIPKNADLTDAQKVQEYIDNEHAETTYDPKYKGAYDDRPLEPGDIKELNGIIADSPWTEERMEKVFDKLYDGCSEHAESHSELHKELYALEERVVGKPSGKLKRQIEDTKKKLDENWDWFKSFDRRVYLLHIQMAAQVDSTLKNELIERYQFQLEVQRLYQESRYNFNRANAYLNALFKADPSNPPPPDFAAEVISVLRQSWKALKTMIKDAREINLPAMKNFEEGERLADFILEGKLVPEPPLNGVKGVWIDKLMTQLNGVKNRCFRLHFKSVGGILAMQEKIAAAWVAARTPVAAEVIDFVSEEPVEAEVIPAEPAKEYTSLDEVRVESIRGGDEDEVVEAEVIEAEVMEAEILPAVVEDVVEIPEPSMGMAAFSPSASPVPAGRPPTVPPIPGTPALLDGPMSLDFGDVPDVPVVEEAPLPPPPPVHAPVVAAPVTPPPVVAKAAPVEPAPTPKIETPKPAPVPAAKVAEKPAEPQPVAFESDNPFAFDSQEENPKPAPKSAAKIAEKPAEPKPAPRPVAAETDNPFTFDSASEAPEVEKPKASPAVAEQLPDDAVGGMLALDATTPPAGDADGVFSLDADRADEKAAPAKPKSKVEAPKSPPVAAEEVFELDTEPEVVEVVEEVEPEPVVVAGQGHSGFGAAAAKPTNGVAPSVIEKEPQGRRPALRITFVKPGEKSPFAK